jgi:hypothetical protein
MADQAEQVSTSGLVDEPDADESLIIEFSQTIAGRFHVATHSPEPARIMPLFDERELEEAVEFGVARSTALVRELMRAPPDAIIPPR